MTPGLVGFPWKSLPLLSGDEVRLERDARHGIAEVVDFGHLAEVMSSLFVASLDRMEVRSTKVTSERRDLGSRFVLRGEGLTIWLSVEPALVVLLLKRVLGQRQELDAGTPLSEAMTGAALAVLAEVCRRVARGAALTPDFSLIQGPGGKHGFALSPGEQRAWAVEFFLRLDGRSFAGYAAISGAVDRAAKLPRLVPSGSFATPVGLCLVVARCEVDRSEFDSLMLGDVLIPPDAALAPFAGISPTHSLPNGTQVNLCSPGASRALTVRSQDGKLYLAGVAELCYGTSVTNNPAAKSQSVGSASDAQPTALDVVMDAPVVVQIELGTVTLPAHDWLSLRPGDVVTSQLPIARPVTLRVAERAVAEGELVSVDGQVGVRILRFHGA